MHGAIVARDSAHNTKLSLVDRLVLHTQQLVDAGIYRVGTRLPSVRDFAKQKSVSPNTAADVYDRLVATNYLESRPRVGFFVKSQGLSERPFDHGTAIVESDPSWRIRVHALGQSGSLNVSTGKLPADWRDSTPIRNALKVLSTKSDLVLTEYADPQGDPGLRRLLQARLLDLQIPVRLPQILLTIGASQATDLVARALLKPGDTAIIESPGYCSLRDNLQMQGIHVVCVTRTADGPDLLELESLARAYKPKFLFVQSVLHSPTGSTISLSHAHRLLKLAEELAFTILENDSYADMMTRYAPRLAALDQSKVLYAGSFSKTLSASARVGYICGPEALINELGKVKAITSISGTALTEQLLFHALSTGDYKRSLDRLRNRLAQHMQLCCDMLEDSGLELFCRPLGGKFVWVKHPRFADCETLIQLAARQNIIIAGGNSFQTGGEPCAWFRINVAFAGESRLQNFLRTL